MTAAHESKWERMKSWAGILVVAGFLVYAAFAIYELLDQEGYLPHSVGATIQAKQNWLVGESKECISAPLNSIGAARLSKGVGYALAFVFCDGGPEHNMRVTFYGREEQPEHEVVTWRCTRSVDSFTCRQTGVGTNVHDFLSNQQRDSPDK